MLITLLSLIFASPNPKASIPVARDEKQETFSRLRPGTITKIGLNFFEMDKNKTYIVDFNTDIYIDNVSSSWGKIKVGSKVLVAGRAMEANKNKVERFFKAELILFSSTDDFS